MPPAATLPGQWAMPGSRKPPSQTMVLPPRSLQTKNQQSSQCIRRSQDNEFYDIGTAEAQIRRESYNSIMSSVTHGLSPLLSALSGAPLSEMRKVRISAPEVLAAAMIRPTA